MKQRRNIGASADDVHSDVRIALQLVSRFGLRSVELSANNPQIDPAALSESGRSHLARLIRSEALVLGSVVMPARGRGLGDPSTVDEVISQATVFLRLAADLGATALCHETGNLATDDDAKRDQILSALRHLAEQAERFGVVLAIGAISASASTLTELIDAVDCPLVRVALDPAELLTRGVDPHGVIQQLADRLAITYLRDATVGSREIPGRPVALGDGDLQITTYLAQLSAARLVAPPVLRNAERLANPAQIKAALARLDRFLPAHSS